MRLGIRKRARSWAKIENYEKQYGKYNDNSSRFIEHTLKVKKGLNNFFEYA